jgi:hypothetical protein
VAGGGGGNVEIRPLVKAVVRDDFATIFDPQATGEGV